MVFLFKQKTAYEMRISDWSSDVCSSDLILAANSPDDVAIEALRSFRTSLQFALMEAPNNIVMFTGPTPGLGKSFVSMNLGAVLAATGKKIVVVDGDLRRGHLQKYIGQGAAPGLSDSVVGNADIDRSEEHTSELQSLMRTSYAVFCLN